MPCLRFSPTMETDKTGDYVDYSDYLELKTTCNELQEQFIELEEYSGKLAQEKNQLEQDLARANVRIKELEEQL